MKDILLITPPFTQLNTPYPATAYLKGFLNTKEISSFQMDLGIEVILELLSREKLSQVFRYAYEQESIASENSERIFVLRNEYLKTIDEVINFLQGKNPTFARQICTENFLPQASRFDTLEELDYVFGTMGMQDKAKHLATLYLEDLSDFIKECIDDNFGFSRYAERLGVSANSFSELNDELNQELTFIDDITLSILEERITEIQPKLICFSVPFPGNLYSAFRCAQFIKGNFPEIKIGMGGGFPNTELRDLKDARVFDYFDFITLDDGELPVELLFEHISNGTTEFKRTLLLENGEVAYKNNTSRQDYKQAKVGTPDYADLILDQYISVIEIANPMHSLWSDGRWNKLTMAHGCYWGKCTFCDISLDYIKLYEPVAAQLLVDRMEEIIVQTGETGFHFVDEAAPPALMRELALEIIRRNLTVTWWTNIRFEKSFTQDLCFLLKASGCIAVSGGLEVASDRLLKLIDKGVTVEQVAQVTNHFTKSGILVHSYLMYGYPTQTEQETIDSLEMVKQLFELGIVQSGFWHQFALTTHSPIGEKPEEYGITPNYKNITFANNDVDFTDSTGIDHSKFSDGLKKSLFNFMHGIAFEVPVHDWFDFRTPKTKISKHHISNSLEKKQSFPKLSSRIVWLGNEPLEEETEEGIDLIFHDSSAATAISLPHEIADWLVSELENIDIHSEEKSTFGQFQKSFNEAFGNFEQFWNSNSIGALKEIGLLVV